VDLEGVELSVAYRSELPMTESEKDPDRSRMGKNLDGQLAAAKVTAGKRSVSRSTKVGSASAFLLFLGVALWMVVIFVEVDSLDALKFYGTAAQLWPFLIGAAAFGWIIQSALPDD